MQKHEDLAHRFFRKSMEGFIENVMQKVHDDCRANLNRRRKLNRATSFDYRNYEDSLLQQCYLLKYFPAYLFEYYLIYKVILSHRLVPPSLSVLSVGAGSGIDYYGLLHAIKKYPKYRTGLLYRGLDKCEWPYRREVVLGDVKYRKIDLAELTKIIRCDYNIIIFPKSLSEFSKEAFTNLLRLLGRAYLSVDRLCVAASHMMTKSEDDIDRFTKILNCLSNRQSFEPVRQFATPRDFMEDGAPDIKDYALLCGEAWRYPPDVRSFFTSITSHCPSFRKNGRHCQSACCCVEPMLKTRYFRYRVAMLERTVETL